MTFRVAAALTPSLWDGMLVNGNLDIFQQAILTYRPMLPYAGLRRVDEPLQDADNPDNLVWDHDKWVTATGKDCWSVTVFGAA